MRQTEIYDERPTIAERYSSAVEASNLKVSTLTSGPVDVIIAAGWCGDGMGASLYRLRAEYDGVAANVRGAGGDSAIDHALVLVQLKSLKGVKLRLWDLAVKQGRLMRFDRPQKDFDALVGKCLDVFLDPNCRPCEGRGFNGGGRHDQTGPQVICRRCKGTGKRSGEVGKDDEERSFGARILALMEQSTAHAEENMAKRLRKGSD